MIRPLLCLALLLCHLGAADMVHQRVIMKGGEELVGWWCADQGVLYLDDGKRRLIDKPAEQVASVEAAPTKEKAPARKQFKELPDLPYASVTTKANQSFVGWWDSDNACLFTAENTGAVLVGVDNVASVDERQAPGPMPANARRHLTVKAVEQD